MARQASEHAQVAKIIKAKLKSFGIKCTAKSDSFSMGNSVNIDVENQPPWIMKAIKEQTDCYEYGTFDAMTDCQGTKNRDFDGPQTKYLSINNSFTSEVRSAAWVELCDRMQDLQGKEDQDPNSVYLDGSNQCGSDLVWRYLTGFDSDFCYFKKPVKKLVNKPAKPTKSSVNYTIEEHTHTKKGTQIFICVAIGRMERDLFDSERTRATASNGWYSRKWGDTPGGFAFGSMSEAQDFCGYSDEPTKDPVIKSSDNIVSINISADVKKANKFEQLADKMQTKIDDCFRDRPTHTARMMSQAQSAKVEGARLERTQKLLRALSEGLAANSLTDELRKINSKSSAMAIVATKLNPVSNGYHTYHVDTGEPLYPEDLQVMQAFALIGGTTEEEAAKKLERELEQKIASVKNSKIPGYFPTTGDALEFLMGLADVQADHNCLEPSAGRGDIADKIKSIGGMVDCIEFNSSLAEILTAKNHNVCHDDFLKCTPDFTRYDRIVMNPPFEKDAAAAHIEHALKFLDEGGKLTAVIPNGMLNKTTPKIRSLLDLLNGDYEIFDMNADSFKSEGTRVNTQIIQIWR